MTTAKEISIWAKALLLILDEGDKEKLAFVAKRLLEILRKKKKIYLLPEIIKKLEVNYSKKNKANLFLAREHSGKEISLLERKLAVIFGKEKKLEISINENLIGGFQAKTDAILVKASIRDFLQELKEINGLTR